MRILIITILLGLSTSTIVLISNQCACDKITYVPDCSAASNCKWDSTSSSCVKSTGSNSGSTSGATYCSSIADSLKCAQDRACAYIEGECIPFAGCSAYLGSSNSDCQAIHKYCNSDGTYCVDPASCSSYKNSTDCTEKSSSSGSGTCVWDSACRDQKCTEASTTFTTDAECKNFISTCVTTRKGCTTAPLTACATFTGDATACDGLKGSDGYCEGTESGTKCSAKQCKNAPDTTTTDADCAAYQVGCVTNNKGCVTSLTACATYTTQGSETFCNGLKGSDGECAYDTGTKCKLKSCESASTSLSTDTDCNNYRSGCYTTGKGCITTRAACSSYKGTTDTCQGYYGTDGYCKGTNDTTASACTPKLCNDAPNTLKTDAECDAFQKNCKTTGKGCTATLTACNTYTGDASSCDGMIGTDGRCKGTSTVGSCSAKVCTEAPTTLTTNEDCYNYQTTCVTQTGGGCIQAGTCSALFESISCQGKSTCQFGNQCVANAACSSFTTQGLCMSNKTKDNIACYWSSSSTPNCRTRVCGDAPTTYKTNTECEKFLSGCWTNGRGCFDQTVACTSYFGTKTTCETYSRKCTNTTSATDNSACSEVQCTDNTTATTDNDCATFKKGCVTKGTGCVPDTNTCNQYTGTQAECDKFKGNKTTRCWYTSSTGSGTCSDKQCTQAPTTVTSDADCKNFLETCLFKGTGAGCIDKTSACSNYSGNSTQCLAFTGNSKKCIKLDVCADRACADITSATNQDTCTAYKTSCRYFKGACVDSKACTAYTGVAQLSDCQDVLDNSGTPLKCWWTSGSTCKSRICTDSPNKSNDTDCNGFKEGCIYNKTSAGADTCLDKGNCNTYYGTPDLCKAYKNGSGVLCWSTATGTNVGQCTDRVCSQITDLTNDANCTSHLASCIVNRPSAGNACVDKTSTACAGLSGTQSDCQGMTGSDGKCWDTGQTGTTKQACKVRACGDVSNPSTDEACSSHLATCVRTAPSTAGTYTCVVSSTACSGLKGTDTECKAKTGNNVKCWKSTAAYGACADRTCADITPTNNSDAECTAHLDDCRFTFQAVGSATKKCISIPSACTSYFEVPANCKNMKAKSGANDVLCWSTSAVNTVVACENRTCAQLTNPTSDSDCQNHMSTCRLSYPSSTATCINQGNCATYTGTQTQCKTFVGSDGNCWSDTTTNAACRKRNCADNTTATTDAECAEFQSGCKTSGRGCVDNTTTCASLSSSTTGCSLLTSATTGVLCKGSTGASGACTDRVCTDNGDATTDTDCNTFLEGCITKGKGCVPKTTECKYFVGNQSVCSSLTGNGKKCWGLSTTATAACVDRTCEHNTTATTDETCEQFLTGCLTTGAGCIGADKACSSYKGIQATCSKFKGTNKTLTCTNSTTATATSACIEVDCTKNTTATSDAECQTYGIQCVYKGGSGGCYKKGPCSQFQGSYETCPLFTATDGPCKGTVAAGSTAACTPRICTEAPNSNNTDALCKTYHPTCVTNGYGCQTSVTCNDIQSSDACGAVTGCAWSGQCRDILTNCSSYTSMGASICKNSVYTGNKKCVWKNSQCTEIKCEDLPATYTTEDECVAFSTTCTTNGAGCVTKSTCASYLQKSICTTAKSTDGTFKCSWDDVDAANPSAHVGCRTQQCKDAPSSSDTNEKCNTFISGCKTSGKGCINSNYACSEILTQALCLTDGSGGACLWVKEKCYSYSNCNSIALTTNTDCQLVTNKCTTDDTKCIPYDKCSQYVKQSSCLVGTDGRCGWAPSKKCQLFTACTDVSGTTNDICKTYNSACITDGTACIEKTFCSGYATETACNSGGTDGICYYDKTSNYCRQRECTDATTNNKTLAGCKAYDAKDSCVTTGTGCIAKAECATYTTQAGCAEGTDGVCAWNATAKTCKLQECTDITLKKSADCSNKMSTCVSDGTTCVAKGACSTYTSLEACTNGGGTDGVCAFTPSSSATTTGTCKLMSACADANSDKVTCLKYSNSCKWTAATTTTSSSCDSLTCATNAKGSVCYPVLQFDQKSYNVCILQGSTCVDGEASGLTASDCFKNSANTYTWDQTNSNCKACFTVTPNTSNTTNTTNTSNTTGTTTYEALSLLGGLAYMLMVN